MKRLVPLFIFIFTSLLYAEIGGELKTWHKVTLTFDGPACDEQGEPNPFLDYRMNVTFTNGSRNYVVPGYFAADGDAANTSATSGNKWRTHFAPDTTGSWNYTVSFRQGDNIAVSDDPDAGSPVTDLDGLTGSFDVSETDKSAPDFRAKGRLEYVGERYLRFAGTGEYFLKQGADAPENFLAYEDFDNTPNHGNRRKSWQPHAKDWREGDPSWQNGKGTEIIGAINYLASEEMNVFSFLTLNIKGDDENVFPYISDNREDFVRFDCSKLDQWEIVFNHGQKMGMYLHFKTQETENEMLLDNGDVGVERKLYYRELIARFGHHLALNWNLGEENGALGDVNQSTEQRQAMAQYFYDHDPYRHHIVIHNGREPHDLLGDASKLTGYSLQTSQSDFSRVHRKVIEWINRSVEAGKTWVVACDEPGDATHALVPDADDPTHDDARRNGLWGCLIGGGAGNEWYFGYQHAHSDLTCQDWRSRDLWWDQCRIALHFFKDNNIPFWQMRPADDLAQNAWCLAKEGDIYVAYARENTTVEIDLTAMPDQFLSVQFFNPKTGDYHLGTAVRGGQSQKITAPVFLDDFAALIKIAENTTPPSAPESMNAEPVGERKIKVSWTAGSDADPDLGGYAVYRDDKLIASVPPDTTTFLDTQLKPNTTYSYSVAALNSSGVPGPVAGPVTASTWPDETPPKITDVSVRKNTYIFVSFSEKMDEQSVEQAENYSISNQIRVKHAMLRRDSLTVLVALEYPLVEGIEYTLTVNNVKDLAGNVIPEDDNTFAFSMATDNVWVFAEDAEPKNGAELKTRENSLGHQVAICPTGNARLEVKVDLPEEGDWYLWGRLFYMGSGNDPNSFFVSVDGGSEKKFGNSKSYWNQWHWDGDGDVESGSTELSLGTLSAGEHTLMFRSREPLGNPGTEDVMLDMLYFTMKSGDKPTDEQAPIRADVESKNDNVPQKFELGQNYPNPFNPTTTFEYTLPNDADVYLEILNTLGQTVDSKHIGRCSTGRHSLQWSTNDQTLGSASGIYFYKLVAKNKNRTLTDMKKMVLLK